MLRTLSPKPSTPILKNDTMSPGSIAQVPELGLRLASRLGCGVEG